MAARSRGRGRGEKKTRSRRTATAPPPPPLTPGAAARAEALEYRGLGKGEVARRYRRRRVLQLLLRGYGLDAIAEETGWKLAEVEKQAAEIEGSAGAELDEHRALLLDALGQVPPEGGAYQGLSRQLLELAKMRREKPFNEGPGPLDDLFPVAPRARAGGLLGLQEAVAVARTIGQDKEAGSAQGRAQAVFALRAYGFFPGQIAKMTGRRLSVITRYLGRIGLSFAGKGAYDLDHDLRVARARWDLQRQIGIRILTAGGAAKDERAASVMKAIAEVDKIEHVVLRDVGRRAKAEGAAERPDPSVLRRALALPLDQRRREAARIIELHRQRANPELWEQQVEQLEAGRPGQQVTEVTAEERRGA